MKLFYLAPIEKLKEVNSPWHALDLGTGRHLACVRWKDEREEMIWSNHPDVVRLPHPIFESTMPLSDEHLKHLCNRFEVSRDDGVHAVIKQAAKQDPFMRLEVL